MADDKNGAASRIENLPKVNTPEVKRCWGDEVDDEESETAPSGYGEKELNIASLAIDENKNINKFLDDPEDSNIKAVTSGDTPYTSASTFEDLKLSHELLQALYVDMNFERPSKIQAISLPMVLTPPYKNLIAQAHNGSGKTTCFVLGMLSRVNPTLKAPQALCVCPTRELAIQNLEVLRKMGKYTGITSECAVPMDSTNKIPIAKRPPITAQIVIGTPGTIKKWMSAKKLSTRDMKILVFDEADHMLDQDGFQDDSLRIMKDIERNSAHCQVLLFSATFNEEVKIFVSRVVKDGNQLFVKKEELSLEAVKQYKVHCPGERAKVLVIKDKIFELGEKLGQTIIFVRTRKSADMLHKSLVEFGWPCTNIQGALPQEVRDKIVKEFKDGLTKVLISTDILARGFDQAQVNLVVNYDLPVKHGTSEPDYEVYLHRIGRAGRFGRKGAVFNLLCGDMDMTIMEKIEKHFGHNISEVPSWESDDDFEAALKAAGLM
ncbi:DEAD-box ATP-dependent RNA helicase 38-like isoform X2 [Telopea speciosissima]|uniref:DEAD-box ATP-dependent RNA helicase 38-like isoform X2 n=1 Tax=Telopea speciosissima TaxID=54955 RepID=UPI001CC7C0E9|nr:DEAD-box ATP-dependent RNA helicase 38-like isoform X2 [Telopea speciosissima]